MEPSFLHKVVRAVERYDMLRPGDRVCVALSGGPDSVALLRVLTLLQDDYGLHLVAAHVNHGLRGKESDRDEAFVRDLGASMGVPVEHTAIPVQEIRRHEGGSIEEVCRRERYRFLDEVCQRECLQRVALGHTLNDQAETVVMRFLRGSGTEGLKGMLPVRDGRYIRPFLEVQRDEVLTFLDREGMTYVTDSSNFDRIYLRNSIRGELIPALRDRYNDRLMENMGRMSDILREEDDYLERSVLTILSQWQISPDATVFSVPVIPFNGLHCAMQRRVIKFILDRMSSQEGGMGYAHIEAVRHLMAGDRPQAVLDLPFCVRVEREYDTLVISKGEGRVTRDAGPFTYAVPLPGTIDVVEAGMRVRCEILPAGEIDVRDDRAIYMDYESIRFPLEIRETRRGDRIRPLGMRGTKKVQKIFIDEKVPKKRRGTTPLLVDRRSVLWIMGMRMSDTVKVTDMTEKVVKAEII